MTGYEVSAEFQVATLGKCLSVTSESVRDRTHIKPTGSAQKLCLTESRLITTSLDHLWNTGRKYND